MQLIDPIFSPQAITKVFLIFFFLKEIIQSYLELRNKKHILKNKSAVPEKFQEKITLEDHQKAATYNVAKINLGQFFQFYDFLILLGWTLGGGLNWLDSWIAKFQYSSLASGLLFFTFFALINMVLSLPESIYSTFFLEEKFGFNKTTPKIFITDRIKGLVLGAIIGLPLLAAILWIMGALGNYWWAFAWALLTLFQFFLMWAYPTLIAPLFNKFSPMEEGEVKDKVLSLLSRTGFTSNGLFVMDASMRSAHGNAYFTGFGKNKRIVFFDTLIKTLDPSEVEAVLAHELGHFKKKHVMKGLARSILFSLIGFAVLGFLYKLPEFYQGHGVATPSNHAALLLFGLVSGIYLFLMTPLSSKISRKYEFEADEFASNNSEGSKLITALVKMYKDNASTLTPDPVYSNFYHSHPPALVRVKFLESLGNKC